MHRTHTTDVAGLIDDRPEQGRFRLHRDVYLDAETARAPTPIYAGADLGNGHRIEGPAIVEEATTTILIGPGDRLEVDAAGNYLIELGAVAAERGGVRDVA